MTPHVLRRGKGGPPLVFIHCALAQSAAWAGVFAGLKDHACVAFDLPGHGQSPPWDIKRDYQAQCVDWMGELVTAPTHIVGHSFGGTVALRFAVERPDLVSRLTLIEPVYFAAVRDHDPHALEAHVQAFEPVVRAYEDGDHMEMAKRFTSMWGTGQDWASIPQAAQTVLASQMPLIIAQGAGITEDSGRVMRPGMLERIECPVHLIRGSQTQPIVPAIQAALADRIPNTRESIVEGAGHMVPLTHARTVAALIRQ